MDYKQLAPSIFLKNGIAMKWFDSKDEVSRNPVELALNFANYGADAILIFDLSNGDEEHEHNLNVIKTICRKVDIPVFGAGNVKRLEDIKKLLYAGCRMACLNYSKEGNRALTEEVGKRFGRSHIGICAKNVSELESSKNDIKNYVDTIILVDENATQECCDWVKLNCSQNANPISVDVLPLFKSKSLHEEAAVLRGFAVHGISGGALNTNFKDYMDFKRQCKSLGVPMNTFDSSIEWEEFKLNSDGMVPVIVQDYKTDEVLMLAYMNQEAFRKTISTGIMHYWSRSRDQLWQKGETSGHFQYVKSLTADCDKDTILARVLQIGAACHTGNRSCFFNTMMKKEYDSTNPLKVFENEYKVIRDRKEHPKPGSYTNYLLDKGIDKILKKVGEECTEIIIAAKNPNPEELKYEIADWLYHAMVLMVEKGVTWEDITKEIAQR
ncbi:MAG: bifunctional phosphoribosyl-AMP cyclohydrolase/phosphoribosyl-ATP diphosphatase HisIE [Lachnospiraceae bacterium]|nr:bifunctional phosphoribosyl-AMP cyclohydrolase/phosphoribosyl-ATP diphosphatase HisIE [Lachnospiraceae bacterium]